MQQARTAKTPRESPSFLAEVKGASVSGEVYVLEEITVPCLSFFSLADPALKQV